NCPDLTVAEIVEIAGELKPPLPHKEVFSISGGKHG
ncbi:unnamed protein product, partial [marine sediment metagenome]